MHTARVPRDLSSTRASALTGPAPVVLITTARCTSATTIMQLIYSNLEPVSEGICNERGVETPPCSVVSQGPAPWRLAEAAAPWALLKTGVGPTRPGVGWVVCVTGWRLQGSGDTFGQRGVSHGDFCSGCTGYKEKLEVYQVFS